MKNVFIFIGFIALAAVIGFSFTSCNMGGVDGGDGGGGGHQGEHEEPVVLTLKMQHIDDYDKPGNEDWDRWEVYHQDEGKTFDLSHMHANKKVYIFTYKFSADQDIDRISANFVHKKEDWSEWSDDLVDYTVLAENINANTKHSGKMAFIPKDGVSGRHRDYIHLRIIIRNRHVDTPATLRFNKFEFEQVDKEEGLDKWIISDKEFAIDKGTFAEELPSFEGKNNVLHIRPAYNLEYIWKVMGHDLSAFNGKTVEVEMSMDVYLKKDAWIAWQLGDGSPEAPVPPYPVISGTVKENDSVNPWGPALPKNTWHHVTGKNFIKINSSNRATLYLSGQQIKEAETYIANATIKITDRGNDKLVILKEVIADGSSTSNPTKNLTLTFNEEIPGLNKDDITLSDGNGNKGTLSKTATEPNKVTYTLPVTISGGGNLNVTVSKTGYAIFNSTKTITVYSDVSTGSFAGTWNTNGGRSIVFSGSSFTYKVNGTTTYSGTFSVSGSTITFNAIGLGTASGNFSLSGNTLTLSSHTWDSTVNGTYTKDSGTGGGTDVGTFLNGKWAATGPNRNFVISGNTWTYYESSPDGYSKGTWSSTVTPAAGTTGTITLTITQINSGGWTSNLPSNVQSVKTNTATFTINAAGNTMTITNPNLTTNGVWGTLAGTYTKDSGSSGGTAPTITTTALTGGTVGTAYNQTLAATGDTPITWTIDSGTLPTGLTLATSGVISGTPTTAATSTFTVKATNAKGNNTKQLSITIASGSGGGGGDPVNWTAVVNSTFGNDPSSSDTSINSVTYGNNKFVVGAGQIAYSSNGTDWTKATDNSYGNTFGPAYITGIAWGNDKFVAVGRLNSAIAYSSNGIAWTTVTNNPFGSSGINGITWGNNKFVAVGDDGKIAYSSEGTTWTAVGDSKFGTDRNDIYGIAYGNGKFVAGGRDGKMAYSSDGITWAAVADSKFVYASINAIAWGNNTFVAVGGGSQAVYSTDGITWTKVADTTFSTSNIDSSSIYGIAWGNNKFVAVGQERPIGGTKGKAAYSSDGITWTAVTDTTFGSNAINAIAWGNNKFIAVGKGGKIAYWDGN